MTECAGPIIAFFVTAAAVVPVSQQELRPIRTAFTCATLETHRGGGGGATNVTNFCVPATAVATASAHNSTAVAAIPTAAAAVAASATTTAPGEPAAGPPPSLSPEKELLCCNCRPLRAFSFQSRRRKNPGHEKGTPEVGEEAKTCTRPTRPSRHAS